MNDRTSAGTLGRPRRRRDFHVQKPKALAMPSDDRRGRHEHDRCAPTGPDAREPDPQHAIGTRQPKLSSARALEHVELVAQGEDLAPLRRLSSGTTSGEVEEPRRRRMPSRASLLGRRGSINDYNVYGLFRRDNQRWLRDQEMCVRYSLFIDTSGRAGGSSALCVGGVGAWRSIGAATAVPADVARGIV